MPIPPNHLVPLDGNKTAGSRVFTSAEQCRGRHVKVVATAGAVHLGVDRSSDAVEGQLTESWEEIRVPLSRERLDMVIEALQVARLQAFGTPLT